MDNTELMATSDADFLANFDSIAVVDNDPVVDSVDTVDEVQDTSVDTDIDTDIDVEEVKTIDTDDEVVDEEIEEGEAELDDDNQKTEEEDSVDEPEQTNTDWTNVLNTPVNINGQDVVFNSPEELVQAVQNYAKVQQRFDNSKAQRKLGAMLEGKGITNSSDVSLLIDIFNGDTAALASFIKNKGIDIDSLDTEETNQYVPKNYESSESQEAFNEIVDTLNTTQAGRDVLVAANEFDQASINDIIKDPTILTALTVQKENGVYDKIMSEVTRLKAIGEIPNGTPILQAYLTAGEALRNAAKTQTATETEQTTDNAATNLKDKVVVAKGKGKVAGTKPNTQAKKAKAVNNNKVPKEQKMDDSQINTLSDDDFIKNFGKLNKL